MSIFEEVIKESERRRKEHTKEKSSMILESGILLGKEDIQCVSSN